MKKQLLVLFSAILILTVSCKKDNKDPEPEPAPQPAPIATKGPLYIHVDPTFNNNTMNFGTKYVNQNGDTMIFSAFKFFISNIILVKEDNSTYTVPESYHLVNTAISQKQNIYLTDIPFGNYKSIRFMLGIDSTRNRSGAQTGALDPSGEAIDMFWTWNSGYIMMKIEGTSPQSGDPNKNIAYHLGGYGGVNKIQKMFDINFASSVATVAQGKNPGIFLKADISEFFKTPNLINLSTQHTCLAAGTAAKMFADNYADMITFGSVVN